MGTDTTNNTPVVPNADSTHTFSQEQIKAKIVATVGEDTPEDVLSMLLADEEMVSSAVAVLRKEFEAKRATALIDAKQKMKHLLNGTAVIAKPVVDDVHTRMEKMTKYQQKTFSVLSPAFVFKNVDMAASWRRYLINLIIGLRNLMKVVEKTDPDWTVLESKTNILQKHIDAADAVLEGFWTASVDYRSEDLRKQVELEVFMNSEYSKFQDLLQEMGKAIDDFRTKYRNNAGSNTGNGEEQEGRQNQKRHNKKDKKNRAPRSQDQEQEE